MIWGESSELFEGGFGGFCKRCFAFWAQAFAFPGERIVNGGAVGAQW